MRRSTRHIIMSDDAAAPRMVMVHGPRAPVELLGNSRRPGCASDIAVSQHAALVSALVSHGIRVLDLLDVLSDAMRFPDARDWLLERHFDLDLSATSGDRAIVDWLDSLSPTEMTVLLLYGAAPFGQEHWTQELPAIHRLPSEGTELGCPAHALLSSRVRWIGNGAVVGAGRSVASRSQAANVAAALNFSPAFEEAYFEFWLDSVDPSEVILPEIDTRDLVLPAPRIVVAAITRDTSGESLRVLSRSLLDKGVSSDIIVVDMLAFGSIHLDECFIALDHNCFLVDRSRMDTVQVSVVVRDKNSVISFVPSKEPFLQLLGAMLGSEPLRVVDGSEEVAGTNGVKLSASCPIVLGPGKILAFSEYDAAFPHFEAEGIEIADAVSGSAFLGRCSGPRQLVTVVSTS